MVIKSFAVKSIRRAVVKAIHKGQSVLRVVGTPKTGYWLAGERGRSIVTFGRGFSLRGEAEAAGVERFGIKAKPVVMNPKGGEPVHFNPRIITEKMPDPNDKRRSKRAA